MKIPVALKYTLIAIGILLVVIVLLLVAEIIYIKFNGKVVLAPAIPRGAQTLGSGPKLTYVVMGDSTSIGQGADYKDSYAVASANHLAKSYSVTFINVGISGATAQTVVRDQLHQAATYKPDLALLAVGGNDAKNFVKGSIIRTSLQHIIDSLRAANPNVQIVVTGSPAMDSVSRFPIGAKQIMQLRTSQVNTVFRDVIAKNHLTLAPIAQKTRAAFLADHTLTAQDNFHPNARGYALWTPVVDRALDSALAQSK